jgi:hypothetical protein
MPADLFEYWRAYSGIKPFGHQDRILAHIMARLMNVTNEKGSDVVQVEDILPYALSEEEERDNAKDKMLDRMNRI